jgi:hypothetical protein
MASSSSSQTTSIVQVQLNPILQPPYVEDVETTPKNPEALAQQRQQKLEKLQQKKQQTHVAVSNSKSNMPTKFKY